MEVLHGLNLLQYLFIVHPVLLFLWEVVGEVGEQIQVILKESEVGQALVPVEQVIVVEHLMA
jgi:hypothetical protein